MRIQCAKCYVDLGEILKGSRIRKGTVHLCAKCEQQRKALELIYSSDTLTKEPKPKETTSSGPFDDLLKGLNLGNLFK